MKVILSLNLNQNIHTLSYESDLSLNLNQYMHTIKKNIEKSIKLWGLCPRLPITATIL